VRSRPHQSPGFIKLAQISNISETLSSIFGIDSDFFQVNILTANPGLPFGHSISMEVLLKNSDNTGDYKKNDPYSQQ